MKRNGANLKLYKETCKAVMKRSSNVCEVLIEGKRCGKYIPEEQAGWINFLHKETRNGKSDEWVLSPDSIVFGCAAHHIEEERTGKRVDSVDYEDGELTYIPEYDNYNKTDDST